MNNLHTTYKVTTPMKPFGLNTLLRRLALLLLLASPLAFASTGQQTFATPEAAVEGLVAALKANDDAALLSIFGDKHKSLVITGDRAYDTETRANAVERIQAFHALDKRSDDRRVLLIGTEAWPVPIPLIRQDGAWHFATEEGVEELINRRIGGNERQAIHVLRTYLEAQRDFASRDRIGDGVLQYAQKLGSSPGKQDGLYWPADETKGEETSPFGPLIAASSAYLTAHKEGDSYLGYHFRILTSQGKNAPGGAYNYIINGRMLAGFALIAYPAAYGESGVMTFIVNQNGKVYEKDLGENTVSIGSKMRAFNPGSGWSVVTP